MTIKELKYFIFDNYYKRMRYTNENCYYSIKHQKKNVLLLYVTKLIEKNN